MSFFLFGAVPNSGHFSVPVPTGVLALLSAPFLWCFSSASVVARTSAHIAALLRPLFPQRATMGGMPRYTFARFVSFVAAVQPDCKYLLSGLGSDPPC
eukprot:337966-Prymnesium_polylepis.1